MPMVRPAVAFLLLALPAHAAQYVVQCATGCTAADGLALAPDTGQAIYAPPALVQTTLTPLEFIARLSPAESGGDHDGRAS